MKEFNPELQMIREEMNGIKNNIKFEVENMFCGFTKFVRVSIGTDYDWETKEHSVEYAVSINFIEKDGKEIFGAGLTLNYNRKVFSINHGSCGVITKDDWGIIERDRLVAILFDDEEKIIKAFDRITNEFGSAYIKCEKARYEIEDAERVASNEARELVKTEALANLKVGQIYSIKTGRRDEKTFYKIYKLTPQKVYVKVRKDMYDFNSDSRFYMDTIIKKTDIVAKVAWGSAVLESDK